MLQINYIRENKTLVIDGLKKKYVANADLLIDEAIDIDQVRRETQHNLDVLLSDANNKAKLIGDLMKLGKKEEAEIEKAAALELRSKTKELQELLSAKEQELTDLLVKLPNLPHVSVPVGKTAEENITIHAHGEIPTLHADAQPHWELIKKYDIIDFDLGNKITGAGFPVYKNKGARLQRALINFFLDEAAASKLTK